MVIELRDVLTVGLSAVSFTLALAAFVMSYRQRAREDKRGIRKSLTDTLIMISQGNYAMAQLRNEAPTDSVVTFRRQINAQRRYLSNHANFLMEQIPELTEDIDHNMLASAFDASGDAIAARKQWEAAVEKSANETIRAFNLRGFARFLFFQGNPASGREKYEESIRVNLPDDDRNRNLRADTYLMWSVTERDGGFIEEARRRREQAIAEASRIGITSMRDAMLKYVASLWSRDLSSDGGLLPSVDQAPDHDSESRG